MSPLTLLLDKMLGPFFLKLGNKKKKYIIKKKSFVWHFLILAFECGGKENFFDAETKKIENVNYIWELRKELV